LANVTGWSLSELLDLSIEDFRDWSEAAQSVRESLLP
jgi:hypothetical protein